MTPPPDFDADFPKSESQRKAELDKEKLKDDIPKGAQKVELDLDDAPFLEKLPEPPPAKKPEPETTADPLPAAKKKKSLQKLPLIMAAAALIVVTLGGVIIFLFLRTPTASVPVPTAKPETSPASAPAPQAILHRLEPFLVEQVLDGKIAFLQCRFTFPVTDRNMEWELKRKNILIRDAVYYYLKNMGPEFIANKDNSDKLKKDLVAIVNRFISTGQINEILVEEYSVR